LRSTQLMARNTDDPLFREHLPRLAAEVIQRFRPEAPFGFALPASSRRAPNLAGFMGGAAGAALALHAYVQDNNPTSAWDTAMLLT